MNVNAIRVLDLFCGVGGASVGYAAAGCTVTGVDINPQPNYPYRLIRADALTYVAEHWEQYDVIHASPPCQAYTTLSAGRAWRIHHPDLVPATRGVLNSLPLPWIMENVPGAMMRRDLILCGKYFGLDVIRHRYFEVRGMQIPQPPHVAHDGSYVAVYGRGGGEKGDRQTWRDAMRLQHAMTAKELANALPPDYTQYIAEHWYLGTEVNRSAP